MPSKIIQDLISSTLDATTKTFDDAHIDVLDKIIHTVVKALKDGKKILLCGNGGSAADAQHIAAEFIGRFKKERESYPAIALTTDTSILTAVGNDYGFDTIFERQVQGLGNSGDVLIGISTSGNSPNVLKAIDAAQKKGMRTIGFTGAGGGAMADRVEFLFDAKTSNTPDIQASHIIALHILCEVAENSLCDS